MNKTVICIPSHNNRYTHILGNLKNIDTCYDIAVFLSEGQYKKMGYDKYDWAASNITYIETECTSVEQKLQVMLDYSLSNGYTGMFEIDDDVLFLGKKITEESKRTTSNSYRGMPITFNELLHKVEDTTLKENAAFGSPMFIFALGFSKPGKINVNTSINFGQCTYFDLNKIKESGIKYDTSSNINADVDFVFELLRHGYKCITLGDYAFQPDGHEMYKDAMVNQFNLHIGMYLKYRDGITLVLNKNGLLTMRCNLKKYWNTFDVPIKNDEYHKGLYEICKTRDRTAIENYIKENKK